MKFVETLVGKVREEILMSVFIMKIHFGGILDHCHSCGLRTVSIVALISPGILLKMQHFRSSQIY